MNLRMLALSAVTLFVFAATSGAQGAGCRPTDEHAHALREYAVLLATEQSPQMDRTRHQYGIVVVPASEVKLVTDTQTCGAAARKYKHVLRKKGKSDHLVYVVRVGERYIVYDPDEKVGEFTVHMVFDKHFVLLASFAA